MVDARLTVASKNTIAELADKIHELLVEHDNTAEASGALSVANALWNSMPYKDESQRTRESMGLTPEVIAAFVSASQRKPQDSESGKAE